MEFPCREPECSKSVTYRSGSGDIPFFMVRGEAPNPPPPKTVYLTCEDKHTHKYQVG